MTLPSFKVGKPIMPITSNTYPTNFGDLADPQGNTYSRVNLSVPVTRHMAMSVKTFVPIVLIVICAAFVFFVRPHYAEGRIGLDITALLTLVALQLTSSATLPDVDYLMILDKIYLLAYVFIIAALARVVLTSWRGADEAAKRSIMRATGFGLPCFSQPILRPTPPSCCRPWSDQESPCVSFLRSFLVSSSPERHRRSLSTATP
jgi:hypothetical protein